MNAERALLGAVLVDPDALARVRSLVDPDDFADRRCRLVFEALLSLPAIDFVLLSCELERRGTLDEVRTAFLCALCLHTPTSLHAPHYAREVARAGRARREALEPRARGLAL